MLPFKSKPKNKQTTTDTIETIRETIGGIGSGFASTAKDVGTASVKDFWAQVAGEYKEEEHILAEGKEFTLPKAKDQAIHAATKTEKSAEKPKRQDVAPGLEYQNYHRDILRYHERNMHVEGYQVSRQVEQILVEIQKLIATSTVLEAEFRQVAMETTPTEVGSYHVNFFEWMLIMLKAAREKIEDSGAWMNALTSKKGKRNYWAMFKKHGTTFGLSNERSVATQSG